VDTAGFHLPDHSAISGLHSWPTAVFLCQSIKQFLIRIVVRPEPRWAHTAFCQRMEPGRTSTEMGVFFISGKQSEW